MNQQPLRVEGPRASWRGRSRDSGTLRLERPRTAVVVLSWTSAADGASSLESSQIELIAELEGVFGSVAKAAWSCRGTPERSWVDAIVASSCSEVVLTADALDSELVKEAVLELAGLLTRQLERTKPAIRVRFLSRPLERRRAKRERP